MRFFRIYTISAALLFGALASGCALNPATGKRQFMLVSQQQERAIGLENDRVIVQELGLYEDEELARYVDELGQKLAATSEMPDLDWTFRVLDDPVVNAFALPGGYIYVTRGILAHMNTEAELASVLGHEIGHVTGRHGASRMSKGQFAQLGMLGAMVLAPEQMEQFGGALQQAAGLLFLKYSRDDEREADDLGLRYMIRGDYDPREMPGMFRMLGAISASQSAGRLPGWMSTHPLPENRESRIASRLAASGENWNDKEVGRERFLGQIDGIVFGDDPRQGYFVEESFYHPEMRFTLDFPAGFQYRNQRQMVSAVSKEQDAAVQLMLSGEATAAEALSKFLAQEAITVRDQGRRPIHGLTTAAARFAVPREQNPLEGVIAYIEYDGQLYGLMGLAVAERFPNHERALTDSIRSFRALTDRRRLDVQPYRLNLVSPTRPAKLRDFASRNGATLPVEALALVNRVGADDPLVVGRPYKLVRGGPR